MTRALIGAVAVYGALMRLAPRSVRLAAGGDMREMFAQEASDAIADGALPFLRYLAFAYGDLLLVIVDRRARRRAPSSPVPKEQHVTEHVRQDVRDAWRSIRRQPGLTAAVTLTIALGVGANAAVFAMLNVALLRPLPYPESDRLVRVWGAYTTDPAERANVNPLDILDWRAQNRVFADIGALTVSSLPVGGNHNPAVVSVATATAPFLPLLGVTPQIGRLFTADEQVSGQQFVAVVSHAYWQTRAGGDRSLVGRTIRIAGVPHTVIGVLPNTFTPPAEARVAPDVWRPLAIDPKTTGRGGHFLSALGRLKPDVSIEQAQADMDGITAALERAYPSTNTHVRVLLQPLHEALVGDTKLALELLAAAVALVLLIACANVANLLLARATVRHREIAIRLALGASRVRVLRQLLTECLLLAACGGGAGIALAWWLIAALPALGLGELPAIGPPAIDGRVLAFTVLLSILTGLACGLAPALHASRPAMADALKQTARGATPGWRAIRGRELLLAAQVATASVVLIGAALLVKSFDRLLRVDPGFETSHTIAARVTLLPARYADTAAVGRFYRGLDERLRATAGVTATGAVNIAPLSGQYSCDSFGLGDREPPPDGQEPCAESRIATAGYFRAMGLTRLEGRAFDDRDSASAMPVVVITESMRRKYWPGTSPLGARFAWGSARDVDQWRTIIGVVSDVHHFGLDADVMPEVYMPQAQARLVRGFTLVVRADGDPAGLGPSIRAAVRDLDRDAAVWNVQTTREIVARSVADPRLRAILLGAFAALSLVLATVGVYGVMAFFVGERRQEIGVRVALGAQRRDVLTLVLGRGVRVTGIGIAAGVLVSLMLTRWIDTLLFGVGPRDIGVFTMVPLVLFGVALVAAYVPARRATRLDPLEAIRAD